MVPAGLKQKEERAGSQVIQYDIIVGVRAFPLVLQKHLGLVSMAPSSFICAAAAWHQKC